MNVEILEQIGLTKSEISVYLALLELGSSSTGKIVDKSKVASSKVYEILDKLIQKGLVSFIIKAGVKYFEAAPPDRIMDYMEEKEKRFNKQKNELKKILPELELKQKTAKYKSEATIYKGLRGMETAFNDALKLLKSGDEHLAFGIPKRSEPVNRFFIKFNKERARRKIKNRIIFTEQARTDPKTASQTYPENNPLAEIKFTNEVIPAAINVFNDRVIIFPSEVEEPLIIVIDNKEIAESFRVQFERWWDQDTTASHGFKAFEDAWSSLFNELKTGESYNVFGAAFGTDENQKQFVKYFQNLHKKRIEKGIKSKILFQKGAEEVIKKYKMDRLYSEDLKFKTLPFKVDFPVEIYSQGDTTLLLIQKKDPTIITIKNKDITKAFINFFETMWKQIK